MAAMMQSETTGPAADGAAGRAGPAALLGGCNRAVRPKITLRKKSGYVMRGSILTLANADLII
jgi:hypothetical protein